MCAAIVDLEMDLGWSGVFCCELRDPRIESFGFR
jgi:hypothetical protein